MSSEAVKQSVVFYHGGCPDGRTAASIVKHYNDGAARVEGRSLESILIPLGHNAKINFPETILWTDVVSVYFVDICPSDAQVQAVLAEKPPGVPVNIYDHHEGVFEHGKALASRDDVDFVFDNSKSGASLAWHLLFGEHLPQIVHDIEDIDLWKHKRPYSHGMTLLITMMPEVSFADEIISMFEEEQYSQALFKAKAVMELQSMMTSAQAEDALMLDVLVFDEELTLIWQSVGKLPVVATDGENRSFSIGKALAAHRDEVKQELAIGFWHSTQGGKNRVKISIRGIERDSAIPLAKILGGNGHKFAAGGTATSVKIDTERSRFLIWV